MHCCQSVLATTVTAFAGAYFLFPGAMMLHQTHILSTPKAVDGGNKTTKDISEHIAFLVSSSPPRVNHKTTY